MNMIPIIAGALGVNYRPTLPKIRINKYKPHQSVKEKWRRIKQGKNLEFCQ